MTATVLALALAVAVRTGHDSGHDDLVEGLDARGHAGPMAFGRKAVWEPEQAGIRTRPGTERACRDQRWMR